MLEEDHKELWCPLVRESGGPDGVYWNRPKDHQHPRCIGSECPLWRWSSVDTSSDTEEWHGYCGLGGPPHAR